MPGTLSDIFIATSCLTFAVPLQIMRLLVVTIAIHMSISLMFKMTPLISGKGRIQALVNLTPALFGDDTISNCWYQ